MITLDLRGLSCPEPVIKTKKALKESSEDVTILLDSRVSFENVTRFLDASHSKVEVKEKNGEWEISVKKQSM